MNIGVDLRVYGTQQEHRRGHWASLDLFLFAEEAQEDLSWATQASFLYYTALVKSGPSCLLVQGVLVQLGLHQEAYHWRQSFSGIGHMELVLRLRTHCHNSLFSVYEAHQ